ncbi:IclR family transcriptional regulator [Acuticoccus sp. M5D2P5]|uniref:IclR family transcriptional regulator n=1 Tax=Acuticoccus kalidii TaxID=2910977 RepID=UPI001F2B8008|nr:IclR family transcriptional regulator [Acuticoccus kalidii]MCF3935261.1 IclR family transcriptional regulator [Acuticoccus kalidii]
MSSLQNALRLLAQFSADRTELRVTDLAEVLSLPKSSVSRLLKELTEAGLVEREAGGRAFRIGPELFRLGHLYRVRVPVQERVDEVCQELLKRYPATAYLAVLRGFELVVLRRHEGWHPVRYIMEPGDTIPAFATAVGRALLARLPMETLEEIVPDHLTLDYRDVDASRQEMLDELVAIRERGCALMDDRKLRVAAIGVAVSSGTGRDLGFALSFATEAIATADRIVLEEDLMEAAWEIGRLSGDPYWQHRTVRQG